MTGGRTSIGIVGAGIVGAALGRALTLARPDLDDDKQPAPAPKEPLPRA